MTLIPVDRNELKKFYKRTKLYGLLKEFADSGCDCVKIDGVCDHYKTVESCIASFDRAIKRFKMPGIKIMRRNGEVYLVKEIGDAS